MDPKEPSPANEDRETVDPRPPWRRSRAERAPAGQAGGRPRVRARSRLPGGGGRFPFGVAATSLAMRPAASQGVTMFADLLHRDRERSGLTLEQAARQLGVTRSAYRALEAAELWPSWETYDRIERLFGWPQTFVRS
jgi:DNA-binding XRE family transcriptional regulator